MTFEAITLSESKVIGGAYMPRVEKAATGGSDGGKMLKQFRILSSFFQRRSYSRANLQNRFHTMMRFLHRAGIEQHAPVFQKPDYPPCDFRIRFGRCPAHAEKPSTDADKARGNFCELHQRQPIRAIFTRQKACTNLNHRLEFVL